jgi:hypothetical protein
MLWASFLPYFPTLQYKVHEKNSYIIILQVFCYIFSLCMNTFVHNVFHYKKLCDLQLALQLGF